MALSSIGSSKAGAGIPKPTDTPGCPTVTRKLRFPFSDVNITVPVGFVTLFSYTGSGNLWGFVFDFQNGHVTFKWTMDSDIIVEMSTNDLMDIQIPAAAGQFSGIPGGLVWETAGSRLRLDLRPCVMPFETLVKIEAKRIGGADKTMNRSEVTLTQET